MKRLSPSPSQYDEEKDVFISTPFASIPKVADLVGQADNPTPLPGAFFSLDFKIRSCDLTSLEEEQYGVLAALLLALPDALRERLVEAYRRMSAEDPVPPPTPTEWEADIAERERWVQEEMQRDVAAIGEALASSTPKRDVAIERGMTQKFLDDLLAAAEDPD